jgi:hypothetical protein
MGKYILPNFEGLDLKSLEEFYDAKIQFNGNEIDLDLNFELDSIDAKRLDIVKDFIENLSKFNSIAVKAIKDDFISNDTVKDYIKHHLEELDEEDLSSIIDKSDKAISAEDQMLLKLHLKRIGFYPENEQLFAMFDYTIGEELTDYVIVVNFTEEGEMDYLTMEN